MTSTPASIAGSRRGPAPVGFRADLIRIVLFGAAVRLVYVVVFRRDATWVTDPQYYHDAANLLADGRGFISPLVGTRGEVVPAADHPPLFTVYLAAFSFLGVQGLTGHALAASALGLVTVVLGALVARELAGDRAGLVAGFILAVYPGVWTYNGQLFAETAAMAAVAAFLLATVRLARAPSIRRVAVSGALVGLAALARSELVLLGVLGIVPVVMLARELAVGRRLGFVAAGALAAVAVIAPWAVYNLTRFDDPVLLSSQAGLTLAGSNCDRTYAGELTGYWHVRCAAATVGDIDRFTVDQSLADRRMRQAAFTYMGDHASRLPLVMAARVARVGGLVPLNQVPLDIEHEGRDAWVAWSSAVVYYPLVGLAIAGGMALSKRPGGRRQLVVLVAPAVAVLISVALFFGLTRYRAPADVSLCVLAAVGLVGWSTDERERKRERPPVLQPQ